MAKSQAAFRLAVLAAAVLLVRNLTAFVGSTVRPARAVGSPVVRFAEGEVATADRIKMKLQSPEGEGIDMAVSEVVLPSASGQLGVLANHAPMMTALDTGVIRYKQDGKWKPLEEMGEATAKLEEAESKKDKLSATAEVKKAAARLQ